MKPRIYIDTSVIGGCLDDDFRTWSESLLARFQSGNAVAVVSDLTLLELTGAPAEVQSVLATIPPESREDVELDEEARELAEAYVGAGVVTARKLIDAQHIAVATVVRADVVVSWNFAHLVNLKRIRGFNAVNVREGYPLLEIRTPREVVANDED